MPIPTITPLPVAPQRNDPPDEFIAKADAFVAALDDLPTEINAFGTYVAALAASLGVSSADAELLAIAGLTSAANKLPYFTGLGTAGLADFSAFVRTLTGSADATAFRAGLGLGALALLGSINDGNWSGTDLAIANGGTGASSASAARTNLDVYSKGETDTLAAGAAPPGMVIAVAMNTAPTGYLKCNGAAVSRTTYAALFAAIGTTWGAGDGSTTFNVPDLRGEFVRGWDDSRGIDSGRSFASSQADELKAHTHTVTGNPGGSPGSNVEIGIDGSTSNIATSSTGGAETRPRNVALLYVIKT